MPFEPLALELAPPALELELSPPIDGLAACERPPFFSSTSVNVEPVADEDAGISPLYEWRRGVYGGGLSRLVLALALAPETELGELDEASRARIFSATSGCSRRNCSSSYGCVQIERGGLAFVSTYRSPHRTKPNRRC